MVTNTVDKVTTGAPDEGQAQENNSDKTSVSAAEMEAVINELVKDTKDRFPSKEEVEEKVVIEEDEDDEEGEEEENKELPEITDYEDFEDLVQELGFKNLNAVAKSYKEMQRRATKAEEERNFYRQMIEKGLDKSYDKSKENQSNTLSGEEYLNLFYEKPFEALDTYLTQRLEPVMSKMSQMEDVVELQQAIQKYPDMLNYQDEIVATFDQYPELSLRPNALETVYLLVKGQNVKKDLAAERERGKKEATRNIEQKRRAMGISGRGGISTNKDISKMSVAELEKLLPRVGN